jgi:methylated-DNA-[protein]-cysteine S-methyltransferase
MAEGDQWWVVETPFGPMLLAGSETELHHLFLPNAVAGASTSLDEAQEGRPGAVAEAERQLEEYFAGKRLSFDLALAPQGTDFQRRVWFLLAEIPYGSTATYGDIAARAGRPKACRAVGATNGRNPLPLVLPCHRVIGSNGKLVGYGGGIRLKQALLEHERAVLAEASGAARQRASS